MRNINKDYQRLLLSELRMVAVPTQEQMITDRSLQEALTLNENMKSFGYTFNAKDLVKLAGKDLNGYFENFKSFQPDTSAKPMYPDFPSQVMDIDEATFRFHQVCHYFSTYGFEFLTGEQVMHGWVPNEPETPKTIEDKALLSAKVLESVSEDNIYNAPFKRILEKRERMNIKEQQIIDECIKHPSELDLNVEIPFKENLTSVFTSVMDSDINREDKVKILSGLCQHTGDVWKCMKPYLDKHKWNLSTSQKRDAVALLEAFPVEDFRSNLIITNKKASQVTTMLEFLSYNRMSKSPEHKQAVADLRNGNLRSWQSVMTELIGTKDARTLSYISQRPGILLRNINWLLNEGFEKKAIEKEVVKVSDKMSLPTLVKLVTNFSDENINRDPSRVKDIVDIGITALAGRMAATDAPFKNKKVYLDWQNVSPENSYISTADEGGYVRSGLALKLPDAGRYMRFFCYWDDSQRRIDIDLHANGTKMDGSPIHVGWNSDYKRDGIVFSGDLTDNNSAEYIDVDMSNKNIKTIDFNISSYTRVPFKDIDKSYTGIMAVSELGQDVETKLYNPKNVLWSHELESNETDIHYGQIDVQNQLLKVDCSPRKASAMYGRASESSFSPRFNLKEYMNLYMMVTNAQEVDSPEDADIVLKPYKAEADNEVSMLDSNYFMDEKVSTESLTSKLESLKQAMTSLDDELPEGASSDVEYE